jgi:hypothetical protein
MKNCLIMGFGRSGTSLMGGILHQAGYFMGNGLYPPRHSNPKGFFECEKINGLNEKILKPYDYKIHHSKTPDLGKPYSPYSPGEGHRWLSYISPKIKVISVDSLITREIKQAVSINGFAYKDPRFNYTLDVWIPFLKEEVIFLCLFRNPSETIDSILTECATAEYLSGFAINPALAEKLWQNSYKRLLRNVVRNPNHIFLFIHYNQLLNGSVMDKLSEILQVKINNRFAEKALNRSRSTYRVSWETRRIYKTLCKRAHFMHSG